MTTSAYVSDVKVEIAFDSGFNTPAVDRTWTDVSQWVEASQAITISYGRTDERSQADANSLSLALDNSDGRFTPGKASSPYYPNVRLFRPIRVTATPAGGTPSVRFTGYINQWPVEWDGSDAYASTNLTAASRMSRMGIMDASRSMVEQTVLMDEPSLYFTMADPADSQAAGESSGFNRPPLLVTTPPGNSGPIVFGSAPGPLLDGLTAVLIPAMGQELQSVGSYAGMPPVEAFDVWIDPSGAGFVSLYPAGYIATTATAGLTIDYNVNLGGQTLAITVAKNALHHIVATNDGGTFKVWVDGSVAASAAYVGTSTAPEGVLVSIVGEVAHLAAYPAGLSAARVDEHHLAGIFAGDFDTIEERFDRYISWSTIPPAETTTDITTVPYTFLTVAETVGSDLLTLLQQLAETGQGVLHDDRENVLTLSGETSRYAATSAFTLDMAQQQVEADFSPQFDLASIINVATATSPITSATQTDETSKNEYGTSAGTFDTLSRNPDDPGRIVAWQLSRYAEPRNRIPSVTVDVGAQVDKTPSPDTLLAADIGTLMTVTNQPSQAEVTTGEYFVEGYTETFGATSHSISFNVSPALPYTNTLRFNDSARGFNSGAVFAY